MIWSILKSRRPVTRRKSRRPRGAGLCLEPLERRTLLSASPLDPQHAADAMVCEGSERIGGGVEPLAFSETNDASDPDDELSEATGMAVEGFINGSIDNEFDVDMVSFVVTAGQTLQFDLDAVGFPFDSYIRLFDPAGFELAFSDNDPAPGEPEGGESYLQHLFTTGGTYYMGISGAPNYSYDQFNGSGDVSGATGGYRLTITISGGTPGGDPDDQIVEAIPVALNSSTPGTIDLNTDVDMYSITVDAAQTVNFDIDLPSPGLNSYIRLFNSAGTQLAANDNGAEPGEPISSESYLSYPLPAAGTYYLGVSASGNNSYNAITGNGDTSGSPIGPYLLIVTGDATPPGDPDDQISEAVPVAIGGTASGTISATDDVDMFAVNIVNPSGMRLAFDIDVPEIGLDSLIRLFDGSGNELGLNNDALGAAPEMDGTESYFEYTFAPGVYYIGVSAFANEFYSPVDGSGDSGGLSSGGYSLTVTSLPADSDDQLSEAIPVSVGVQTSGTLSTSSDVDMFVITAGAFETLNFDIDRPAGSLNSYIRLFDSAGNELASNNNGIGPDTEYTSRESFLSYTFFTAGTYYLGVSAFENTAYNAITGTDDNNGLSVGDYLLIVTSGPPVLDDLDDQISEAVPVTAGSSIYRVISTESDVDMYAYTAVAGETVTFDIDTPDFDLSSHIRLFDAAGNQVTTDPSFLQWTFDTSGTYYVGISSSSNVDYSPITGAGDQNGFTSGDYLLTITSDAPPPDADPDDQISEAVPALIGTPNAGTIVTATDVDMFSFSVAAGTKMAFIINLPASTLNPHIRVFDVAGTVLASGGSFADHTFTMAGTYYVGVSSLNNTGYDPLTGTGDNGGLSAGNYELTIMLDTDPDDQISEAVPIARNTPFSASISPNTDVDMFVFTVMAGETLSFDVDLAPGSDPLDDPFLRIFDAAGNEVISNDNTPGPDPEFNNFEPFIPSYPFVAAGTYYVAVSAVGNVQYSAVTGTGDVAGDSTFDYTLTITGDVTPPADPDDQIFEAIPIAIGAAAFEFISEANDVDMYSFTVGADETLSFTVGPPGSELQPAIRLFDSGGNQLAIGASFLLHTFATAGTYYLGVSSMGNTLYDAVTGTGDIGGSTVGNYTLIINLSDPDDQISEAQTVLVGDYATGAISTQPDVDMYRFTALPGQTLRFDIDLPGSSLDTFIYLFDGSGNVLASNDNTVGPGEEFSGLESYLTHPFTTGGTYYLGVSGVGNTSYDPIDGTGDGNSLSTGHYVLTITSASFISTPQIIDNSDATGFSLSGSWALGGGPGVGRNGNVHQAFGEPHLPTDIATWTFSLPGGPGKYRVAATWFTNPSFEHLFSDLARFEVSDPGAGVVRGTAVMNQKSFPNDFVDSGSAWEDLGVFEIVGSTLVVKLFSSTDNTTYVIADAIRIERVADLTPAPEIQVTANGENGLNVFDLVSNISFGTVDFNEPVTKTFVISNTGTLPLPLSGVVSAAGTAFEVVAQPAVTTLAPGQSTTFQVRMNAGVPGDHTATVSFANGDGNENPFDFTVSGTVRTTNIIDDGDAGFVMSPLPVEPGGWGQGGGPGREFDYKYNRNVPGVNEFATWTFSVTPGQYRVSTTWPFGFSGYDEAAPYTIFDGPVGGTVRGGRNINQKLDPAGVDYPAGFMFPAGTASSTTWDLIDVVNITGNTLTVLLQADDPVEFVLADSVLIDRLGDIPAGPELVVVESNRNAAAGTLDFGTTQLNHAVDKTFAITNSGTSNLTITSALGLVGPQAGAFQLIGAPAVGTVITPGGSVSFMVRLTAAYEGVKNAAITFGTNDADESAVSLPITGNVLNYRIIDDQNFTDGYAESGIFGHASSPLYYQGDTSFANTVALQGIATATWTFSNMSPGVYYVALTWFDTSTVSPSPYASNTSVTVRDGGAIEGSFLVDQRVAPSSFTFDGASWLILGFLDFSSPTVTVTMTNLGADGVILADGVLITRVGGAIPPGNSESSGGESSSPAAPSAGDTLRTEQSQAQALDQALLNTADWDDDLEDVAALLAEDSTRGSDELVLVAAEGIEDSEEDATELVLDWLS